MTPPHILTLQILAIHGLGPATYWKLIDLFSSPEGIISAKAEQLSCCVSGVICNQLLGIGNADISDELSRALCWYEDHDIYILHHDHPSYPSLLRHISSAPPVLFVRGEVESVSNAQIAIVGSRSSSQGGKGHARRIAKELIAQGLTVTSGLALGVDSAAHRGALDENGTTIAVMATGIEQVYPRRNQKLAEEILDKGGALVTEFAYGTQPSPENFPRRNRIISGLSLGTLVVEAAIKSGSLITARYALEQNREVFAIPGAVNNPLSRGCHQLIREGATLVEHADDIVKELEGFVSVRQQRLETSAPKISQEYSSVIEHVDYSPTSLEYIAQQTGKDIGELLSVLMTMELEGVIEQSAGGYQKIS